MSENNANNAGKFTMMNEAGEQIECEVLFTFDSEETNKNYIVYTDNTQDETGSTKVYASVFDPTGKSKTLEPVETEREWLVIENMLASLQEKYGNNVDTENAEG